MTTAKHNGPRRRAAGGRFSLADAAALPLTGDGHPLRRAAGRRLVISGAISLGAGCLATLAWVLLSADGTGSGVGAPRRLPERDFRPGLRGPVTVLGELAVNSGDDAVTREGRPAIAGPSPTPGPRPADGTAAARPASPPADPAGLPVPTDAAGDATGSGTATTGAGSDAGAAGSPGAVEMTAPAQFSPCFVLKELVRPNYPVNASPESRRLASVTVEAAFYVDVSGEVTASYILRSEGGLPFEQAVLDAVNRWRFEPVTDPTCQALGFWVRLPVVFRSPEARTFAPGR